MTLFVSRAGKDFGIGHVSRQINLLQLLEGKEVLKRSFFVVLCDTGQEKKLASLLETNIIERYPELSYSIIRHKDTHVLIHLISSRSFNLCILDGREFPKILFSQLRQNAIPSLSFDDYRYGSNYSELAVHPLPGSALPLTNSSSLDFQPFSQQHYQALKNWHPPALIPYHRILISFGGSDPAQMARKIVEALYNHYSSQITLIQGPLSEYSWLDKYPSIKIVYAPESLIPYYEKNTVLFTSVGLTLLEGLSFGMKIVCVSPTPVHDKIARKIKGIIYLGLIKKLTASAIEHSLASADQFSLKIIHLDQEKTGMLFHNYVQSLIQKGASQCPVCLSSKRTAIGRTETYTLFLCLKCHSNYQYRFQEVEKPYDESYYQENHQAAYGKSYLEDEPAIRSYSIRRLKILKDLTKETSGLELVEVGSALGLFLDEGKKAGFKVTGVEISEFAREYCEERFQIKCHADLNSIQDKLDALCLWFTLEHMSSLSDWVKLASERIKPGGIFAFSVPNGNGAFARFNRSGYIKARPLEHIVEPSINGLYSLLKMNGFKIEQLEIFGLHPARYFLPAWTPVKWIQKALCLGDTFEIYARKMK